MSTLIKIIVAALVGLFFSSCNFDGVFNQLDGKGEVITQEHELEPFDQIKVEKGWKVVLVQADQPKMMVKANENLHPNLKFSVKANVLKISAKNSIGIADAKTITVYFPQELQKLSASGGSEISSEETFQQKKIAIHASSGAEINLKLETNTTEVEASSGADIELMGISTNFESNASSGSKIDAEKLETQIATAEASSGAEISLTVSGDLTAAASSGGNIEYHGNPKKTAIDHSISGDVVKK